ncbi:NUDIX domain-containing protein [Nocardia sp. CA-107356]|uniref:NUDIX domain-containing protein n=1 Tax=Nocardia sp. CA-107356 TaxID=3239972 RepID=UPI003D923F4D
MTVIHAGEAPEDAALREPGEETGLDGFSIRRTLGKAEYDISPHRFEIQRRHKRAELRPMQHSALLMSA